MASINTRLQLQSKNIFTNAFSSRNDKAYQLEADVDRYIRTITANSSGSAQTILAVSTYGADKNVLVFLKNRSNVTNKLLYVIIGSQQIMRLAPGQFTIFPWRTESGDDLKIYGNDTNGIKMEVLAGKAT
tara:strand:+ start:65 stop:454 length:390 start_codon:yes stop_codon:yes gene_type:complete